MFIDETWAKTNMTRTHGRSFLAYVEQCPAPALSQDDIVIMDNLGARKGQAVRRAIRSTGAKLKTLLRKAAARTVKATWKRIGQRLDQFTPTECTNYILNAGYASK